MTMDQDRLKEFDKAPAETEDTECSWTEWNPESGQYEPPLRTTLLTHHPSLEGSPLVEAILAPLGKHTQEPSPPLSDQSADTEDK